MSEMKWYLAISKPAYERVMLNDLLARSQKDMEGRIARVVLPVHKRINIVRGKPRLSEEQLYPNNLLVQCIMDREVWYVIRNTTGCSGLYGGENPIDMTEEEAQQVMRLVGLDVPYVTEPPIANGTEVVADDRTPLAGARGVVTGFDVSKQELLVKVTLPEGSLTVNAAYGLWQKV